MSKDDGEKEGKKLPRVDFLHFKNNDPNAFYNAEECEQIRYCWGDEIFSSGIVFKNEDDLKKFDVAKERAKEFEKMKSEQSNTTRNSDVVSDRTKYVRKRPAAKSLLKKKPPKLQDVTNSSNKKNSKSDAAMSKPSAKPKKVVPDKQYWDRNDHRFVTVEGTAEDKEKKGKRGKWLEDEHMKMNALLKAASEEANHPSVKDAESVVDDTKAKGTNCNDNDGNTVDSDEVNDGIAHPSFFQLCWKNPCEWFDYVVDVQDMDKTYEPLHYGVMSTWAIRNEHSTRRTALTRLCDRIRLRGKHDPTYYLRCPLPQCVEDQIVSLYPDPENNYSGFYPPDTYDRII